MKRFDSLCWIRQPGLSAADFRVVVWLSCELPSASRAQLHGAPSAISVPLATQLFSAVRWGFWGRGDGVINRNNMDAGETETSQKFLSFQTALTNHAEASLKLLFSLKAFYSAMLLVYPCLSRFPKYVVTHFSSVNRLLCNFSVS